jgi:hypothetical protein
VRIAQAAPQDEEAPVRRLDTRPTSGQVPRGPGTWSSTVARSALTRDLNTRELQVPSAFKNRSWGKHPTLTGRGKWPRSLSTARSTAGGRPAPDYAHTDAPNRSHHSSGRAAVLIADRATPWESPPDPWLPPAQAATRLAGWTPKKRRLQ